MGNTKPYDPKILTRGSTLLIELGTPLLEAWDGWNETALQPASIANLEDLRDIARQYDTFPGGPLLMSVDNISPHQYMQNKVGQLRHIEFDCVEQMPPPVNSTLEENCEVMLGGFVKLNKGGPTIQLLDWVQTGNQQKTRSFHRQFNSSTLYHFPSPHQHGFDSHR